MVRRDGIRDQQSTDTYKAFRDVSNKQFSILETSNQQTRGKSWSMYPNKIIGLIRDQQSTDTAYIDSSTIFQVLYIRDQQSTDTNDKSRRGYLPRS